MAATVGVGSAQADDILTICAISVLAAIVANVVHEGLGHAATALLTGTQSGVLTTVAWSSNFDSRLVAAGGTLANLTAALIFWIVLRGATGASVRLRYFLLLSLAFNLFSGTGYFFFSGVTNFGDWAVVIAGLQAHWLWRWLLVVVGIAAYYGAVLLVGSGLVRYVGVRAERCAAADETYFDSLPCGDVPSLRGRTVEPAWNSAGVAISAAGDRWG